MVGCGERFDLFSYQVQNYEMAQDDLNESDRQLLRGEAQVSCPHFGVLQ